MIEAYYAPTALDVVLILLEGAAELAREVTSNYDQMMVTTTARTITANIFFCGSLLANAKTVKNGRSQA